jgi:phosphatidylglycerophosphate synthase
MRIMGGLEDGELIPLIWERYSPRPLTDGERWTARELALLRRRGYRPRAWAAFVRSSLERSDASRRERPRVARQARAWGAAGGLAWIAAWRSTRNAEQIQLRLIPGLVWWLSVWQMLDWHLGMAEGGDGRPRDRLAAADAVTLTRFWLVPVAFGTSRSPTALPAVIVVAGVSDWLDGALARLQGRTRLGRDLDTTADLAFFSSAAIAMRSADRITPLGFAALTARQSIGLALALGAVFARARRPAIRARPWGAALRVSGLALSAAGHDRSGTALLLTGCAVPPRSTAKQLSLA